MHLVSKRVVCFPELTLPMMLQMNMNVEGGAAAAKHRRKPLDVVHRDGPLAD